jgi:hypothetical protein
LVRLDRLLMLDRSHINYVNPNAGFLPCGNVLIIIPSTVRATLRLATLLSLSLTAVPLLNTICLIS